MAATATYWRRSTIHSIPPSRSIDHLSYAPKDNSRWIHSLPAAIKIPECLSISAAVQISREEFYFNSWFTRLPLPLHTNPQLNIMTDSLHFEPPATKRRIFPSSYSCLLISPSTFTIRPCCREADPSLVDPGFGILLTFFSAQPQPLPHREIEDYRGTTPLVRGKVSHITGTSTQLISYPCLNK